jgi:hypothetical protein
MKHAAPAAEAAYVRQGRALFETVFPNAVFPFEAPLWDIRRLRTSQHKKTNSRIYFTLQAPVWIRFRLAFQHRESLHTAQQKRVRLDDSESGHCPLVVGGSPAPIR